MLAILPAVIWQQFRRNWRRKWWFFFSFRIISFILCMVLYNVVKCYGMGVTSLFPLRRKASCGFLSPLKILRHRPGLNLQILGPMGNTLTTRPPRTAFTNISELHISGYVSFKKKPEPFTSYVTSCMWSWTFIGQIQTKIQFARESAVHSSINPVEKPNYWTWHLHGLIWSFHLRLLYVLKAQNCYSFLQFQSLRLDFLMWCTQLMSQPADTSSSKTGQYSEVDEEVDNASVIHMMVQQ
jgi:hypothetical protein